MTILFKYTPGLIEPETLLKTLMGRKEELRNINRILRNASSGRSLSHAIIIGPKGIGKTHLLRIIYHSVKGDIKVEDLNDYKKDFAPLISPEEEYVDSLDKFILLILRYLKHSGIENIPALPEEILKPTAFGVKEKEIAISYIKQFKNKTKKFLLLLIDNINEIIENFSEEDQSRLREILMTSESVMLIGTAPTIFDSITNHDKPLFNFFEIIWLGDLTFEESKKLLKKYAEIEGRNDLEESFDKSEDKLRAIYELAGGNPRLILSLYQIIAENDVTSVEEAFLRMVDELNPYFRERMKDITTQQREIIDVMARQRRLLTPTEIASKCLLPVNVVNSQIKRLERLGYVQKAPQKRKKRILYEIREKLFSMWRQMRVEAGKKRLGFLVHFYEIWYSKEELITQLLDLLDIQVITELSKAEVGRRMDKFWYMKEALSMPPQVSELSIEIDWAFDNRDYETVVNGLRKYLQSNPENRLAWFNLGVSYYELKKYDESITAYKKAVELKPDDYESWNNLGVVYSDIKEYDKAIEAYKKAVEIKPDIELPWNNIGNTYSKLKKYDEAIEAYKKTVEIKPDMHETWYNLGSAYSAFEKYDEAVEAYKRTIDIKPDFNQAWSQLGFIYPLLSKYDEAITAFKKAIDIIPTDNLAWTGLGALYLFLFRAKESEEDKTVSLHYLKASLDCMPHITKSQGIFGIFALALKELISGKRINMVKMVLDEIEKAGQKELLEFLSPYSTLMKYLETKDREIIDRLKREDRVIVEEMLKQLEGKADQETKQKKPRGKTKRKLET